MIWGELNSASLRHLGRSLQFFMRGKCGERGRKLWGFRRKFAVFYVIWGKLNSASLGHLGRCSVLYNLEGTS